MMKRLYDLANLALILLMGSPAFALMALVMGYYARRLIVMPGKLIRGDE